MGNPSNVWTDILTGTGASATPGFYITPKVGGGFEWLPIPALPIDAMQYKGAWDASTNTPTLVDGTGTTGDFWRVSVAGAQDLGGGPVDYEVNDALIYNGTVWQHFSHSGTGGIETVTGNAVDNTDPANPVINNHIYTQTFFVAETGDDLTAVEGDINKPFKTIKAAVDATNTTGDTVVVFAGQYDENDNNLYKNGVRITSKGHVEIFNAKFDDLGVNSEFEIYGDIHLETFSGDMWTITANAQLFIDVRFMLSAVGNVITTTGIAAEMTVKCDFIVCANGTVVVQQDGLVNLTVADVDCADSAKFYVVQAGGVCRIRAEKVVSTFAVFTAFEPVIGGNNIFECDVQVTEGYSEGAFQAIQISDDSTNANKMKLIFRNSYIQGSRSDRGAAYILGDEDQLFMFDNTIIENVAGGALASAIGYGPNRRNGTYFRNNCQLVCGAGSVAFSGSGNLTANSEGNTATKNATSITNATSLASLTVGSFYNDNNIKSFQNE